MDKVKIKRVKKERKKITTKEKILAGLGLGSTLIGGAGAIAPKNPSTEFVRTVDTDSNKTASGDYPSVEYDFNPNLASGQDKKSSLKQKIKDIFGLKSAQAAAPVSAEEADVARQILATGIDPATGQAATQAQLQQANQTYYGGYYNYQTSVSNAFQNHLNDPNYGDPTNVAGAQERTVGNLTYRYVQLGSGLAVSVFNSQGESLGQFSLGNQANINTAMGRQDEIGTVVRDIMSNNLYSFSTTAPSTTTPATPQAPVTVQVSNVISINNNDATLSQRAIQGDFNGQRYALSTQNGELYNGSGQVVTTSNSGLSEQQISAIKTALQTAHHEYAIVVNSDMTPHNLWDDTGHEVTDQSVISRIFGSYGGGTALSSAPAASSGGTTTAAPYSAANDIRSAMQNGDTARVTQILQATGQDFYTLVTDQALRNQIISFASANNIQSSSFGANTVGRMILSTTVSTSTVTPGSGTQFWSTEGVTQAYNQSVKPFELTVKKDSGGNVVGYTISINDNGRTIRQDYTPATLNQFLSSTWSSSDNFLNASRDQQLLFAAGVNARLIDSNIGLGIANLPVANTSHVQNVKYVDTNGQLITVSQPYGVTGMSFQTDANWVASMFPGSRVTDAGFPGGTTDSWSPSVSSSDSRRYYEVVLPNGSRINVGLFLQNNINTSNGRTTVNVSQDDLRYFVAPNSNVVAQNTYGATGGNATTPGYVSTTGTGTGSGGSLGSGSGLGGSTATVGAPSVSSVNYQGGMLLINGNNFNSTQPNSNKIEVFDGMTKVADFTVSSGNSSLIVANLPTALQAGKTYTLKITVGNQASGQVSFSVAGTAVTPGSTSQVAMVSQASLSDYSDYLKTINTSTAGITTSSQMALWLNGQNLENSSLKVYKVTGSSSTDVTSSFNISAPSVVSVGSGQQVGFGISPKTTVTAGVYRVEVRSGSSVISLPSSLGFTIGQTASGSGSPAATSATITTQSLPEATAGSAYSFALSSSQSGLWSVSGAPSWMNIDSSSGRLYGTPPTSTSASTTRLTVSLTVGSQTINKDLNFSVRARGNESLRMSPEKTESVVKTFDTTVAGISGGVNSANESSPILTPVRSTVSYQAINTDAQMVIVTSALSAPQIGQAYNSQLVGYCNIPGAISWGVSSGQLPEGLTMSHLGVISGVPTKEGSYTFTIRAVANDGRADATKQFTLNVGASAQNMQPSVLNVADDEGAGETNENGNNVLVTNMQPSVLNVADDEGSGDFEENGQVSSGGPLSSVSNVADDENVEYDEVNNSNINQQAASDDGEVEYDEVSGAGNKSNTGDEEVEYDEVGSSAVNGVSGSTIQTFQNANQSTSSNTQSNAGQPASSGGSGSSSSTQAGTYLSQEINNLQNRINQLEANQVLSNSEKQELASLRAEVVSLRQALQVLQSSGAKAAGVVTFSNDSNESGSYTVKKGDNLWDISRRFYGDGTQWRKILEANPQSLSRPGNVRTLRVGYVLKIPGMNQQQGGQVFGLSQQSASNNSAVQTFSLQTGAGTTPVSSTTQTVARQTEEQSTPVQSSQGVSQVSQTQSTAFVNARTGEVSAPVGGTVMPSVTNVGDDEEVEVIE
ncbi:MAG: LysM peptidoglycan-binding domain-containing protein [Candidatus Doudnabacteria bacterium]|nr:LysM peptidoglycan-binding domain-containing protein [Candidatus Doudnabacteria bacterium]